MSRLSRFLRNHRSVPAPIPIPAPVPAPTSAPDHDASNHDRYADAGFSRPSQSSIETLFRQHSDRVSWKWQDYFRIYEDEFAPFRSRAPKLLEIGVQNGGSLQIWRKYFGADARIVGIDADPRCRALDTTDLPVRIGSQDDPDFLRTTVSEMGGVDIVIDDGSHLGAHQIASFRTLFPLLSENGLYLVEDLHAAYWTEYLGGHSREGTMIAFVKDLIDDVHGWYHSKPARSLSTAGTEVGRISIYDSVVAIRKTKREVPREVSTGTFRL